MRISKKLAIKFADHELTLRNDCSELTWYEIDTAISENAKYWKSNPVECLVRILEDGYFRNYKKKDFISLRNFYGDALWSAAVEEYISRGN